MADSADTEHSEAATRCEGCGTLHVIFRSRRPTHGIAVAKQMQCFSCPACGAPLMQEDVGDNESVMVCAASDPLAETIRAARKGSGMVHATTRISRALGSLCTGPAVLAVVFFGSLLGAPYLLSQAGLIRPWWVTQCAFGALGFAAAGGWLWLTVRGRLSLWGMQWPSLVQLVATILLLAGIAAGFLLSR